MLAWLYLSPDFCLFDCDGQLGPDEVDEDGDGSLACDDCDDEQVAASPHWPEVCGDDIDNDCDGIDPPCEEQPEPVYDDQGGCHFDTTHGSPAWLALLLPLIARRRTR